MKTKITMTKYHETPIGYENYTYIGSGIHPTDEEFKRGSDIYSRNSELYYVFNGNGHIVDGATDRDYTNWIKENFLIKNEDMI